MVDDDAGELFEDKDWAVAADKYGQAAKTALKAWELSKQPAVGEEYGRLTWNKAMRSENLDSLRSTGEDVNNQLLLVRKYHR